MCRAPATRTYTHYFANVHWSPGAPVTLWRTIVLMLAAILLSACGGNPTIEAMVTPGCWADVPAPTLHTGPVQMGGITAFSERDVWAVGQQSATSGENSTTLTMHWDGAQWSIIPSPNAADGPTSKNNLYAVAGTSGSDVWAVGAYAPDGAHFKALAMHWDGQVWSLVPTPNPGALDNTIYDVSATASDDAWAVGSYLAGEHVDAHMMVLHWDGKAWSQVETPRASTHNLLAVRAISRDDVWAAGTQVLHWNGRAWNIEDTPESYTGGYLDGIAVAGPQSVWVVGNDGNEGVLLHWDGEKWAGAHSPKLAAGPYPHEVVALSPDDVWAAGEYADNPLTRQLLLMRWDGKTWSALTNPLPGEDTRLLGLTAVDKTLWAVGMRGHDNESRPLFLRYSPEPCGK